MNGFTILELCVGLLISLLLLDAAYTGVNALEHHRLHRASLQTMELLNYYGDKAQVERQDTDLLAAPPHRILLRHLNSLTPAAILPKQVSIIQAKFAQVASAAETISLRADGTCSPGRLVLADQRNKRCEIVQSLRCLRTMKCVP